MIIDENTFFGHRLVIDFRYQPIYFYPIDIYCHRLLSIIGFIDWSRWVIKEAQWAGLKVLFIAQEYRKIPNITEKALRQ